MKTYKITVDEEGTERWYFDCQLHREGDKPAIEYSNGDKYWGVYGGFHREGGKPAVEFTNGFKAWFLHGIEVTEAEAIEYNKSDVEQTN